MSGFCALLDRGGAPLPEGSLDPLMADLAVLGKEGSGLAAPRPWVRLGHRLRRDTPESLRAALPVSAGGCTLVTDVRLDNRDELLGLLSLSDRGLPDSQLLMQAWLRWGPGCVTRLVGDFSFLLWDDSRGLLFGARDPMGHRPFFYAHQGARLACSNSFRALRRWPGLPLEVDEVFVTGALVRGGLLLGDREGTLFQGIRQLPPGHVLEVSGGQVRTVRYWSVEEFEEGSLEPDSLEGHLERFRGLFRDAVSCRLRNLRPVGCHLSGGLDSSSVTALAASRLPEGGILHAFTHQVPAAFRGHTRGRHSWREEVYVEAMTARHPGIRVHTVTGHERELFEGQEEDFDLVGLYVPNLWNQTWLDAIHQQARALGLGAVLEGALGNLTISYSGGAPPLGRRGRLMKWLEAARRGWSSEALSLSALRPDVARRLDLAGRLRRLPPPRLRSLQQGLGGFLHHRHRARFGLDRLDPTADPRVVEFCLRAPASLFREGGQDRLLVRRAMRGLVPDRILDRPDRQLQSADWKGRTLRILPRLQAWAEELSRGDLARRYIDWRRVRSTLQRGLEPSGDAARDAGVWAGRVFTALAMARLLAWVEAGAPPARPSPDLAQETIE